MCTNEMFGYSLIHMLPSYSSLLKPTFGNRTNTNKDEFNSDLQPL